MRTLAMMQRISLKQATIEVGAERRRVIVATEPLSWLCPTSIDTQAMDNTEDLQQELAIIRNDHEEMIAMDEEDADDG